MTVTKKFQLLATSFSYQTQQFFWNSSLHGVRFITESGRPFFEKFLWACCTGVGTTVAMIIIMSVWEKFQTNPTITGLDTNFHNWDVPFPGITLCQDNPVDPKRIDELIARNFSHVENKELLKQYFEDLGSLSRRNLDGLEKYAAYKDFPFTDLKSIAKEVVYRCESIASNCFWKGMDRSCCENTLFPIFTENGFCYTFNSDAHQGVFLWNNSKYQFDQEFIYETDSKWAFEFEIANADNNNVFIFIHSSDEQPSRDLKSHHTWNYRISKVTFSVQTTYTTPETRQLSISQRRCIFSDEVKVFSNHDYTYNGCMRECRVKKTFDVCKCIPFLYNEVKGMPSCDYKGLVCYSKNQRFIMSITGCDCDLNCETSVYEVEKLTEAMGGERDMEIAFVSWPVIRYKREVLFGWVDLLVSFGGIAGLFLGFSLLSGVEIIYYFTMRACCMVLRDETTLEKLKKEYAEESKPNLDLSLTPYFMKKKTETGTIATRLHHVRPYDSNQLAKISF